MSKQSDIVKVSQGADGDPLFIDTANNRVGIGTTNTGAILTIGGSGDQYINRDANDGSLIVAGGPGIVSGQTSGGFIARGGASTYNQAGIEVYTNGAERMRIDSAGLFLRGTATAVHHGKTFENVFNTSVNANIGIRNPGAGAFNAIVFMNDNGQVGYINTEPNGVTYASISDYRLKEDVQPMVGASDRVLALNPVNFAWKVDGTRVDGFLAHEAQTVVPEAVSGERDAVDADGNPQYQGIDQSKLVPLLTAALQEALNEITDLKARVAALEGN